MLYACGHVSNVQSFSHVAAHARLQRWAAHRRSTQSRTRSSATSTRAILFAMRPWLSLVAMDRGGMRYTPSATTARTGVSQKASCANTERRAAVCLRFAFFHFQRLAMHVAKPIFCFDLACCVCLDGSLDGKLVLVCNAIQSSPFASMLLMCRRWGASVRGVPALLGIASLPCASSGHLLIGGRLPCSLSSSLRPLQPTFARESAWCPFRDQTAQRSEPTCPSSRGA